MRKRGRPPLDDDDPSTQVTVKMPSRMYDYLYERAREERISVPEILRRGVTTAEREVHLRKQQN